MAPSNPSAPVDLTFVQKVERIRAEGLEYLYSKDPLVKNEKKAFERLQEAAELGDPVSMDHIGGFYVTGTGGTERSCPLAIQWFERAAALGYPLSLNNLAYVLTTCPDKKLRDTAKAEDALKALFQGTPAVLAALDTYAATQAAQQRFTEAARTMAVVIDIGELADINPERLDEFRAARARYLKRQPPLPMH